MTRNPETSLTNQRLNGYCIVLVLKAEFIIFFFFCARSCVPIHFAVHIGRLLFAICTVVEINSSVLLIFSECKSSTWYCTVMVINFHSRGRRKYEMHGVRTCHCKSVASS